MANALVTKRHKYVKTNSRKLEAFFRDGGKINDLGMVVGQLTGKPKYPPGHVGKKSRGGGTGATRRGHKLRSREELDRQQDIRGLRTQLAGLDERERGKATRLLRRALKADGISSRGLVKAKATAVARVAGVLASREQYHLRALKRGQVLITASLDKMRDSLVKRTGSVAGALTAMGRGLKELIRASFRQTGHQDTGRLIRNTQYEIFSRGGKAHVIAVAKEHRRLRREARKSKKRRRR